MNVTVLNTDGTPGNKTVELPVSLFGIEPNETVMFEAVRQYLAHQRQGTAKTKERAEVARTTKKAFRQKGTGGARRGAMSSPLLKGGGTVFGPRPRKYTVGLTKKMKSLAKASALTFKAKEEAVYVIEDLSFDTPSTKAFKAVLDTAGLLGKKVLVLTDNKNFGVVKSASNLPKVDVTVAAQSNTYEIMNADVVLFFESAVATLETKKAEAEA